MQLFSIPWFSKKFSKRFSKNLNWLIIITVSLICLSVLLFLQSNPNIFSKNRVNSMINPAAKMENSTTEFDVRSLLKQPQAHSNLKIKPQHKTQAVIIEIPETFHQ